MSETNTANMNPLDTRLSLVRDPKMWANVCQIFCDLNPRRWCNMTRLDVKYKLGRIVAEYAENDKDFIDEILAQLDKKFSGNQGDS